MPELPEVESVRRALEPELLGRTVTSVRVLNRSVVSLPGDPPAGFSRTRSDIKPVRLRHAFLLKGCTITSLRRHGKQLAIIAGSGPALCIHLGMTGSLRMLDERLKHTHVIWTLDDSRTLAFVDPRRFGFVSGHRSHAQLQETRWHALGPDALGIGSEALREALKGSTRGLKAFLLDQTRIAGLGNIYIDEALFRARLHPLCPCDRLQPRSTAALAHAINEVLEAAINAGGSTIRDYRNPVGATGSFQSLHRVYGRGGYPCTRCGMALQTTVIAQRTTVWCPACQPNPFD